MTGRDQGTRLRPMQIHSDPCLGARAREGRAAELRRARRPTVNSSTVKVVDPQGDAFGRR